MDIKIQIKEILEAKERQLSVNSMKTYVSLLSSLYKKLKGKNIEFFIEKNKEIMEHIKNLKNNSTKKTILTAYYIFTNLESARLLMISVANDVNKQYSENIKSAKEKDNWMSQENINKIILKQKAIVVELLKKRNLNIQQIYIIRNFLCVYFYFIIPPRRAIDFTKMKLKYTKNINNIDFNFYDMKQNEFIFNNYKTAKSRGQEVVKIENNEELIFFENLLKRWQKLNNSEFMIFNNEFKELDPSGLTKILNKIFDAKISVNMLRHIKITNVYNSNMNNTSVKNIIEKLNKLSGDMGHSLSTQKKYYKK